MPAFICDVKPVATTVVTGLQRGGQLTTTTLQTCPTWREVPFVVGGSYPAASDAALAYAAGFTLILGPFLLAWAGAAVARIIRGLS